MHSTTKAVWVNVLQVLVAGVPCPVDVGSVTATSIACRVPSLAGQLLAEYWQLPSGTYNLPGDIDTYTNPGEPGLGGHVVDRPKA
jgi:hypothetical protein